MIKNPSRLEALRELQIMDTDKEPSFDRITALAKTICQTPICYMSLIDEERQWYKSKQGMDIVQNPIEESICTVVLNEGDRLVEIPDISKDKIYAPKADLSKMPDLAFYAGAVLEDKAGNRLGTLCAIDFQPRKLKDEQLRALRLLADQAEHFLNLRKENIELAMFRRFFEMSDDLMSINKIKEDTLVPEVSNPATYKYLGLTKESLNYDAVLSAVSKYDPDKAKTNFDKLKKVGSLNNLELKIKGVNGLNWFNFSIKVDEKTRRAFTIARNINQSVKDKKKLESSAKELKSKNKDLKDFAYAVSHDIQEPVRNINSLTNVLIEDYIDSLDQDGVELMNLISESSDRLRELVIALLDNTRIGKNEELTKVDLNVLINDVKLDLNLLIQETQADFKIQKLPQILGSKIRIHQLFQNMIQNALKYRRPDVKPYIEINYQNQKYYHKFMVKDNGQGIKEKYWEEIFGIFKRFQNDENSNGLGIGLANCKKIVEQHNGKIWVEKNDPFGCVFCFTIKK